MSKSQILSGVYSLKSITPAKKISIKFLSKAISVSRKSFNATQKPLKTNSKPVQADPCLAEPVECLYLNEKKTIKTPSTGKCEVKPNTQVDFLELENRLSSIENTQDPEEKLKQLFDLLNQCINIPQPFSNILSLVGTEMKKISTSFTNKLNNYKAIIDELQENKQTLKLLKKRFQKLAIENLELSNSLKEKENDLFRSKEKLKQLKVKVRKDAKSNFNEVQLLKNELERVSLELRGENKRVRKHEAVFNNVLNIIRAKEDLGIGVKEIVLETIKYAENEFNKNVFFSNEMEENSAIFQSNASKLNSFFSSCDIEI